MINRKVIHFTDCLKTSTYDQDKAITPEETVARFLERIKIFNKDICRGIERIDNGRLGIPVYSSLCGKDMQFLSGKRRQMGKGASLQQAQASACMELAERYSFFSFKSQGKNFLTGDYTTLQGLGYPILPVRYLLQSVDDSLLAEEQFTSMLEGIPLRWCWATNLATGKEILFPFSWFATINEYNGSSAGNTLEEAAVQGISEVVERHVCAMIAEEKRAVPEILLADVTDPLLVSLFEKFTTNGIELHLYDFSLDTGLCCVGALAWNPHSAPGQSEIVLTAGAAPSPRQAMVRAITEIAQLAGDFNTSSRYEASGLPKPAHRDEMKFLGKGGACSFEDLPNVSSPNMLFELQRCSEALQQQGMDIFVIDITHADLNIPALYTVIPGTHFYQRAKERSAGLFAARIMMDMIPETEQRLFFLKRMAHLVPDASAAYYLDFYHGKTFFDSGLPEEALPYFARAWQHAISVEDQATIASYYGNALCQLGRYDDALPLLQKGCAREPDRADLYNLLGICFYKKQMYEQAVEMFSRAVDLDPTSAMDYANLGVNYAQLHKRELAIEYFSLALSLDPSITFAKTYLDTLLANSLPSIQD